jgi:hypothetical protein
MSSFWALQNEAEKIAMAKRKENFKNFILKEFSKVII